MSAILCYIPTKEDDDEVDDAGYFKNLVEAVNTHSSRDDIDTICSKFHANEERKI